MGWRGGSSRASGFWRCSERPSGRWGLSAGSGLASGGLWVATEQSSGVGIAGVCLFVRALAESDRANEREERYDDALDAVEEI